MRAWAWNAVGWVSMWLGSGLHDLGMVLCGWAGDFDARADSAGYWDHRSAA